MKKTGIIRQSTLKHFGLKEPGTYESPLHKQLINDVKDGIANQYQMAIVADFGSGKSQLQHMLEASYLGKTDRPLFIHIVSPDKARLNIGSVVDEFNRKLQVTEAGRSVNAKTINLISALGKVVTEGNRNVCLVIDNAHRCDVELFSEIRDLREQHYNGIFPLFSVLFIGQTGLQSKLNRRKEVGWRTQFYNMNETAGWWTFQERIEYLKNVYDGAITPEAQINIASKTNVPLEMDRLVGDAMEKARTARKPVIDADVVPSTAKEVLAGFEISYADVAAEAGVGKSTVSNYINGEAVSPSKSEDISRAIEKLKSNRTNLRQTGA